MGDFFDTALDYGSDLVNGLDKYDGLNEFTQMVKKAPNVVDDLDGLNLGPLNKVMGPIGNALDIKTMWDAGTNFGDAFANDDGHNDVEFMDGLHDLLDGGSGLLGEMPGQLGILSKSFNAGFTVGDMIAPYVFNDHEHEGAQSVPIPENGEFHAETGNHSIDSMIDGVHDISDGNYLDGALDIGKGGLGVLSAVSAPGASLAADVISDTGSSVWKWATED